MSKNKQLEQAIADSGERTFGSAPSYPCRTVSRRAAFFTTSLMADGTAPLENSAGLVNNRILRCELGSAGFSQLIENSALSFERLLLSLSIKGQPKDGTRSLVSPCHLLLC